MKKVRMLGVILITALAFGGCKRDFAETVANAENASKRLTEILPEQYANIGNNHNEILEDFYFSSYSARVVAQDCVNYKDLSVEDYFGDFDITYYFKSFDSVPSRNAENENSFTDLLVENDFIKELDGSYISQIENILNNPLDSLEKTQDAIAKIEINVLEKEDNFDMCQFFSYAETAKASLEFWTNNIETLELMEHSDTDTARWIIKDLWNKYKHKLGMMAASDAAGGAVGAGIGAATAASLFGPEAAGMGAIVGAAVVGAASSAEGFKQDAVCIVVSTKDIENKIKNR